MPLTAAERAYAHAVECRAEDARGRAVYAAGERVSRGHDRYGPIPERSVCELLRELKATAYGWQAQARTS